MANGKLSSSEGARFTFVLRELRCCLESEALEAEAVARKAPPVPSKVDVSIIAIPHNCFVSKEQMQQMESGNFLRTIEHERFPLNDYVKRAVPQAEVDREIDAAIDAAAANIPDEAVAAAPEPEIEPDPLRRRARELGFGLLPRRPAPVD